MGLKISIIEFMKYVKISGQSFLYFIKMVFMKESYKDILNMLWVSISLGIVAGIIFGYFYNLYARCLVIALSISITIWIFNTLLYIFLIPRIRNLAKGKRLCYEIPCFFASTLLGFFIPISIFAKIFNFNIFKEKVFLINIILILLMYIMILGVILSFRFYKELKEKETAEQMLKTLAVEATLKGLKSQLNPHFLFNALNSINALVTQNPTLSRKMIAHLSELLRISLDSHDQLLVPFKNELDFVRLYLEIERIRFGKKMKYQEKIDTKLLDISFPSMVLQPLLENAVKHGIASSRSGGTIQLTIKQEGNVLTCTISNTMGKIKSEEYPKLSKNGTGLANIRQRLNLLYGERYGFKAEYKDKNAFEVILSIPLENMEHNGKD
jgi:sensor histidine kinase YesM